VIKKQIYVNWIGKIFSDAPDADFAGYPIPGRIFGSKLKFFSFEI
jgi:hypothetical protein